VQYVRRNEKIKGMFSFVFKKKNEKRKFRISWEFLKLLYYANKNYNSYKKKNLFIAYLMKKSVKKLIKLKFLIRLVSLPLKYAHRLLLLLLLLLFKII